MGDSTSAVRAGRIVAVLASAGIVASLMQTLVVPLVGDLPRMLDTSASNASWVVTSTLLAAAVSMPVVGRLGDTYGKRRVLLACTVPLIVGSMVCAMATSVVPMVFGRSMQGLGMAMVPLGVSALRDVLPPERVGSAIALMSSSLGIGGAFGLPFAAAVAEYGNWRILFWTSAGLAALIAVLIWIVLPPTPRATARSRFDIPGAVGLGMVLVSLLLAVSKGGDWGWTSATTLGLFAVAAVLLPLWGWFELRSPDPLVDLRVAARPQVLLTNAASMVIGFAMYGQVLIIPQILQLPEETGYGMGVSMLVTGLWMAPGGLMMMLISPVGARMSARFGPKITLASGALVVALGYGSSMFLLGSPWGLLIVTCLCSGGVGLAYGSMPALIMAAVPVSETASANSFNTLMRSIGTTISAAVTGVVLAQMTIDTGPIAFPSEAGFRTALLLGAGAAAVAAAVALTIPTRRAAPPQGDPQPAEPVKVSP